jgi:hypothetical protein
MKLRCQGNSIRLRLKRGEVDQLVRTGRVEEVIHFGKGAGGALAYRLETSPAAREIEALFRHGELVVHVPVGMASDWARGDQISLEAGQPTDGVALQILIEKDFACLNGTDEQNVDTFENPLAGTKC